ncbi:MAG: hypothetical protein O3B86_16990, partial [Planctomycetota bacterium]|nr:hypothetical protein [Planctomycetota bacterium]
EHSQQQQPQVLKSDSPNVLTAAFLNQTQCRKEKFLRLGTHHQMQDDRDRRERETENQCGIQ